MKLSSFTGFCFSLMLLVDYFQMCWLLNILCKWWLQSVTVRRTLHPAACYAVSQHSAVSVSRSHPIFISSRENKWSILPWSWTSCSSFWFLGLLHLPTRFSTKKTVDLLKHESPDLIPPSLLPSNSPDLMSITRYGTFFSSGFTAGKSNIWTSCSKWENAWTSA